MCRRRLLKSNFYINYGGTKKAHGETVIVSPFVAGGDSDTFELYSRNPWVITNDLSWLTVSSLSNKSGKYTITITAAENQTYDERSGSFTAKTLDDRFSIVVSVSQQAKANEKSIRISPRSVNMGAKETYSSLICYFTNVGTTTEVTPTWSTNSSAVTVDSSGIIETNNTGGSLTVTVTATYEHEGDVLTDTMTVNVAAAVITYELVITPAIVSAQSYSGSQAFVATLYRLTNGTRDGWSGNVTESVDWSISTDGGDFIKAGITTGGTAEWVNLSSSTGQVTISAWLDEPDYGSPSSNNVTFNVNGVSITSTLTLTPATTTLDYGESVTYTATVTIRHGSTTVFNRTYTFDNWDSNVLSIASNSSTYLTHDVNSKFDYSNASEQETSATITCSYRETVAEFLPSGAHIDGTANVTLNEHQEVPTSPVIVYLDKDTNDSRTYTIVTTLSTTDNAWSKSITGETNSTNNTPKAVTFNVPTTQTGKSFTFSFTQLTTTAFDKLIFSVYNVPSVTANTFSTLNGSISAYSFINIAANTTLMVSVSYAPVHAGSITLYPASAQTGVTGNTVSGNRNSVAIQINWSGLSNGTMTVSLPENMTYNGSNTITIPINSSSGNVTRTVSMPFNSGSVPTGSDITYTIRATAIDVNYDTISGVGTIIHQYYYYSAPTIQLMQSPGLNVLSPSYATVQWSELTSNELKIIIQCNDCKEVLINWDSGLGFTSFNLTDATDSSGHTYVGNNQTFYPFYEGGMVTLVTDVTEQRGDSSIRGTLTLKGKNSSGDITTNEIHFAP